MAKIIIVDDEYFVRMGIKSIVNQKEKGHSVIGEAENGSQAVPLILELRPDVVFLDITMPGLNGIQVLERIREEGFKGYVAMLTCHEDFSFAQKAMRLGADDYVLKSELVGDDMLHYLDRVGEKQIKSQEEQKPAGSKKREEQHFYKENFLKNILQIGGISKEEFVRGCSRYHVKIHAEGIYLITIQMNHWEQIVKRYKDSDLQVLYAAVDNMLEEIFKGHAEWEGFYATPYQYHILYTCKEEKSVLAAEEKIRSVVDNISYHFERILDIEVTIGVYQNTYPADELYKGFTEAENLLEQHFFQPGKKVLWKGLLNTWKIADLGELEEALKEENREEASFSEIVVRFLAVQKDSLIGRKEFLGVVMRAMEPWEKCCGKQAVSEPEEYETVQELLADIRKLEEEAVKEREDNGYSYLVKQAVLIVRKNFTRKLTLEEVAEQLGISAGYFSRIFSTETGETFSNYLIRKRIEAARELILTTNYKFYEIGEMCGFHSPVHFNNTFKKLCGVTPNQYRKEH